MRIAILGYGLQGESAYHYWKSPENEITVCDQNESLELPGDVKKQLGGGHLKNLDQYDLIVRSPIVHPKDIAAANSPKILEKVTTVTNEFFKASPSKNIIGVTGTKGKGTTSTLIAKMLESAFAGQRRVHLGGNIGIPPLEHLKDDIQKDDWIILELANFQLIDLKASPHIGICLMIVPEHLDWHGDHDEYITAKQQMFMYQTPDDIAIYNAENKDSGKVIATSAGQKIPYMQAPGARVDNAAIKIDDKELCSVHDIKLLGRHNWQNVCAAVTAVWQITQDEKAIRSVLTTFSGLEHRLELVRELDGVKYYDDSFGTTPETAIVAIEAFEEPKVVILGGSDKGASYGDLAKSVKEGNIKKVVLIGATAPKIKSALENAGFTDTVGGGETMKSIIEMARSQAESGDIVLLSAASASFDMFKNYKDRGEQFQKEVLAL